MTGSSVRYVKNIDIQRAIYFNSQQIKPLFKLLVMASSSQKMVDYRT
ncbi:hypothetical protein [Vibrio gallaecicus]|nr:hypothetical protein [Vibrio gallaecicus]MDN3614297.1 hypothetical protein [Vibrio gallaecicus]